MSDLAYQAKGRWYSILTNLGIDEKTINGKHHACPICGGKDRFRYTDFQNKGSYICNQCGSGDGFDLLMQVNNWDFKTAAEQVERFLPVSEVVKPARKKDPKILLRKIQATLTDGIDVARYLKHRGLINNSRLKQGRVKYFDDGKFLGEYSAMVALIQDVDKNPVSYHVTYLQGNSKANVPSQKKVMPGVKTITGCAIRLGEGDHICITEGIETGLAVQEMTGLPVWAAIFAGNMEKIQIPKTVNRVDIYADNDSNFAGQKAAYVLANRLALDGVKVTVQWPEMAGTDYADHWVDQKKLGGVI